MSANWARVPLKAVASANDEVLRETHDPDDSISYVEISDVSEVDGVRWGEPMRFGDAPSRARRVIRDGDVLVSTVRTYLRAVAPIVRPPSNAIASTGFAVVRPRRVDHGFLGYALLADKFMEEVISRSVGVSYPAINTSDVMSIAVAVPNRDVQVKVVEYLDRETAEIDAFIADQEQLIALLEERRRSCVGEAVRSDSARWPVSRVRFHCQVSTGSGDTIDAGEDAAFPFYVRSDEPLTSSRWEFDGDAILTAGDGAGVGKVFHRVSGKFMAHQRVYVMHNFRGVDPDYFFYAFSATFASVALEGRAKSTVDSVRRPMITDLPLVLPPLHEQHAIVLRLNAETASIDASIVDAREAIALSKERRAALISAAVTGRLDVTKRARGLV